MLSNIPKSKEDWIRKKNRIEGKYENCIEGHTRIFAEKCISYP
jgi:hypothetical protein